MRQVHNMKDTALVIQKPYPAKSVLVIPVTPKRQQGAALLVSLVLLVALSLLGISAMQGTIMQERMSVNQRDIEIAFNNAESALRGGEAWLQLPGNDIVALDNDRLASLRNWDPRPDEAGSWESRTDVTGSVALSEQLLDHPLRPIQEPVFYVSWRGEYCKPGASLDEPCDDIFSVASHARGASQRGQAATSVLHSVFVLP